MANERKNWWEKRLGDGPWPVQKVAYHDRPHVEEIAAYVMAKIWGRKIFPGIENAEIEFWVNGKIPGEFGGMSADELLAQKNILVLGIGRGTFDEHGTDCPSCAHLMAEVLGIATKTELQLILSFCKLVDNDGKSMPLDLHSLINDRWDACESEESLGKVFDWAADGIHDFLLGQIKFAKCELDFARTGKIINGPVTISIVESDNRKMNKWIRWRYGKKIDFIVQRKSTGNTIVFTTPYTKVNFVDVVRIVRMQELRKRTALVPMWYKLEVEGDCPESPLWHFSKKDKSQLLNGSDSAPDIEPTALSLRELAGCIALSATTLFKKCEEKTCLRSGCEVYRLGLVVCRQKQKSNRIFQDREVAEKQLPLS